MPFGFLSSLIGLGGPKPDRSIDVDVSASGKGLPIVFGKRKVAPSVVFAGVSRENAFETDNGQDFFYYSDNNIEFDEDKRRKNLDWLYMVNAFCAGPIAEFDHFLISGERHEIDRFKKKPYVRLTGFNGTHGQTAYTPLSGPFQEWTSNHHGKGVAYVVARYLNRAKKPQFKSQPKLDAIVRGGRCYDPRLDGSRNGVGSHRSDDPDSWAYSDNRALMILTYLLSKDGAGLTVEDVDLAAFAAMADTCEEPQSIPPRETFQQPQQR